VLINLGDDLWVRARTILGFGPAGLLTDEYDKAHAECAVLVEWAGWVPCTRPVREVMADCRTGGGKA
jgi:hypothetical protein